VVKNGQPEIQATDWENTAWVDQAVVYGLIPRNFPKPGFQGIVQHLDRLKELGISAIWLSPVNQTPLGNYGYHVMDYFELEEAYGTKEDFQKMVDEAHARGIRVLMDFVPNHTTEHHRYFEDTIRRGKESPYWDFYDRDEKGAHTNYFHWSYLPNLNFNNPKVVRWITEAFAYWVREFDVDGFRVDVAWGIRQRNPEYWPHWRAELKRIKPDLLLLAEAGARDEYYFTEGFDSAYDWTDELGHGAWEHVFEDRSLLCERLKTALTNQGRGFHADALIFRFLNNNDTGARFITRYGVAMTRVATALLLTLPGLPCVYLGDETGTEFLPYKTREPFDWSADPHELLNYHKKLITLRHEMPALYSRTWEILETTPQQKVFAYLRWVEEGSRPVLVLLNFFDADVPACVNIPEGFAAGWRGHVMEDLLTGQQYPAPDSLEIKLTMPAMTALLLSPK
jgi:glycosidase